MSQTTLPAADRAAPPGNVPQATPPTRRPVPGQAAVATVLARADVLVDGPRPWDMRVHDPGVFPRLLRNGSLALGEAYMDGAWDCEALDQMLTRLLRARLFNRQRGRRAFKVGERHYDLGNDLYRAMLGTRLVYSCAYWSEATELDAAQVAKLDLIARKLQLAPGMRVLDIGCGWGEALRHFAEHYGVSGVGLTISREQADFARERCAGFPVEIRVQDYHDVGGEFDRVFSVGMFEHVGACKDSGDGRLARDRTARRRRGMGDVAGRRSAVGSRKSGLGHGHRS